MLFALHGELTMYAYTPCLNRVSWDVYIALALLYYVYTLYTRILLYCMIHIRMHLIISIFVFPVRDKVTLRLLYILGKVLYYVREAHHVKHMASLIRLHVCSFVFLFGVYVVS